jgi:hypothetical protein
VIVPSSFQFMAGIAQLVRAPDCGSGGRGFETHYPPHPNGRRKKEETPEAF